MTDEYWNRPCAAANLISYRCRGRFGWIMIGAKSDDDALSEARRSWPEATRDRIERWDGARYFAIVIRWVDKGARVQAMCGDAPIGAVFPRSAGARYIRWRAFITKNMNPVDGTAPTTYQAQEQVERRFAEFLDLAGLSIA